MRIYCTDCEGPISLNDNAQELAEFFIPHGDRFFAKLSKYDDYLADIEKKPGYRPGMTLRLILPFLKAYGATDEKIWDYSAKHISLVPGAKETLWYINSLMPTFIISTSYKPYILSICKFMGFPKERAFCTSLNLDAFDVSPEELENLKRIKEEIVNMPMIEALDEAKTFEELPEDSQAAVLRLNDIFWGEIFEMDSGKMYRNAVVLGGEEKAAIIVGNAAVSGSCLSNVMYVGDSITDKQALAMVKAAGGAAVSFNGNRYAVENAEIVVISPHTLPCILLALLFKKHGTEGLLEIIEQPYMTADMLGDENIKHALFKLAKNLPAGIEREVEIAILGPESKAQLIERSVAMRKQVRGKAGVLG